MSAGLDPILLSYKAATMTGTYRHVGECMRVLIITSEPCKEGRSLNEHLTATT